MGKKPEKLPLPNLTGVNIDAAKLKIKSWGLNVGRIVSKPDSNRAKYQIISTNPSPYSYLRKGEVVNLLVSSGSDAGNATVDDIKKFEFSTSQIPILTPKVTIENKVAVTTTSNNVTPTSVVTPSTNEETKIVKKEEKPTEPTVKINAEPIKPKPAPISKPTKEVIFSMPDGFMPKEVKFIHIKPEGREQIYSGTHKPLDNIKVKVPIVPNSKIQIYINDVPVEERKID